MHVRARTHAFPHAHKSMCARECVCSGSQRSSQVSFHIWFETGYLIVLKVANQAGWTGKQAPRIHQSPVPWHWDYKCTPTCLFICASYLDGKHFTDRATSTALERLKQRIQATLASKEEGTTRGVVLTLGTAHFSWIFIKRIRSSFLPASVLLCLDSARASLRRTTGAGGLSDHTPFPRPFALQRSPS